MPSHRSLTRHWGLGLTLAAVALLPCGAHAVSQAEYAQSMLGTWLSGEPELQADINRLLAQAPTTPGPDGASADTNLKEALLHWARFRSAFCRSMSETHGEHNLQESLCRAQLSDSLRSTLQHYLPPTDAD
ncbi:hypothetical protein [Atopomonas sediminilitoris]|uniref:hypothetical protein n=1 Tax=Atopomonas sediminilitoris TaxID=2919919 RepID=UPI001F4D3E17|nr:hypothetical protein [Atopomonas sediminilitoris]MCJ8169792.1 hypothetical protein [Atopomonas sediminilitoris]